MSRAGTDLRCTHALVLLLTALVLIGDAASAHAQGLRAPEASGPATPDHVDLMLKWRHQFQFAGVYMADEEGHFQRHGLVVTLHERQPGIDPVSEVLAGRMHYGISSASRLLLAHARGEPVVVLGVIFQHSPIVLLSLDPTLRTPADMAGKRVAMAEDDAELRALLQREGIDLTAFTKVPHPLGIDDLEAGTIDALTGYLGNEPFALAQRGRRVSVINPVDYGVRFYGDVLFTRRDEWTRHRERALRLRQAVFAGWDTALADPARTIERLAHRFPTGKTREALHYEADVLRGLTHPDAVPIGHSSNYRWREMQEHLAAAGMVDAKLSLTALLEPVDDEAAAREGRLMQWAISVLLGAGVLGLAHILSLRLAVRRAASDLQRSHDALAELNRDLEQRIAARTRELAEERDLANALRASRDQQLTQVTHELHSPLHAILGNIGLLIDDDEALSPTARRTLLQKIRRQAHRLLGLVDHLLTSANLEAGTLAIQRETLDLGGALGQVLAGMAEQDPDRVARVDVMSPAAPVTCLGDPHRLAQALQALIDNALRYSPPTSRVAITIGGDDAGEVWVDVADRGPGVPENERARIFERFGQGAAARQRAGGAGLGLSIARGVAELHGGTLRHADRDEGGAHFRLTLPATPQPPRPSGAGTPPPTGLA